MKKHNILIKKILKNYADSRDINSILDPNIYISLTNVNNYLFDNPNINKKGKWGKSDEKTLDNVYSVILPNELHRNFTGTFKYLNIGSGDGKVFYKDIEFLQKEFPEASIQATNRDVEDYIDDWIKDKLVDINVEYIFQDITDYPVEHYNLIIAKVSLHHIPDAKILIQNLKSDYILIREADVRNNIDLNMQVVEHMVYDFIESSDRRKMTIKEMKQYFYEYKTNTGEFLGKTDNYFSRKYWLKVFNKSGYVSIKNNNKKKYNSPNNPTQIYRELFKLKL